MKYNRKMELYFCTNLVKKYLLSTFSELRTVGKPKCNISSPHAFIVMCIKL